jgi:iron-sulfur cluster assembly protein
MSKLIKLSTAAIKQLKNIQIQSKSKALDFYVTSGGCAGFEYQFKPTDKEPRNTDKIYDEDGLKMHICGYSLPYIEGTDIDWKEDYMGKSFRFDNPNAKGKCGCGTSFDV